MRIQNRPLIQQSPVRGHQTPVQPEPMPTVEDSVVLTPLTPLAQPTASRRLVKSMASLAITVGSASAYAATPGASQATVMIQDKNDVQVKAHAAVDREAEATLKALNQNALHELGPQCVTQESACKSKFDQLPTNAQREYMEMPLGVKKMMGDKLNGKTTVIPVILVINHRKSFVKGEALGQNVFDFVQKKTDAMAAKGQIKPEHAPRVRRFLDTCRTLTPQQRENFVDLINRDLQLAK